jgi:arylsulfatase A-like enzyme
MPGAAERVKRPNILLITSDEQRADAVGWADPRIRTPNLDALAGRGIVFDRAYTVNPVCTPARCSILTGHRPSRHGCYTIGTSLPDDYPTIPAAFSRAGYFTGLLGKGHFTSCCTQGLFESPPHIFDTDFFRGWDGPFFGFEHARLSIDHGSQLGASGMHYGAWLEDQGVDPTRYFGNDTYEAYGPWDLPEELHYSKWTADQTLEAVDRAAQADKPFYLWSSFQDPHNPCVVPEPWASLHDDVPVDPPLIQPEEFDQKPAFYRSAFESNSLEAEPMLRVEKPWACLNNFRLSEPEYAKFVRSYWGMISLMDHHIGRITDGLAARNQLDNTLIVFTSDHGEYLGNHGFWWKWLPAYEDIHRIPFMVVDPACETPGTHSDALQSNLDLGLSFLRRCGIEETAGLQGADQGSAWLRESTAVRDSVLIEFRPTEGPFAQNTLVTDRWKLVVYTDPGQGELYDLSVDPDQLRNLWAVDAFQADKTRLLQQLLIARMDDEGTLRERTMWA